MRNVGYKGRVLEKSSTAKEYLSRTSNKGELKPFQAALIPPELIRINQFERGLSTRQELLEIYLEVGREKSKYMLDALAFGF